jgi:hypothetical protein
MYVVATTRFNQKTWNENERWRENNNFKGCIYNTPKQNNINILPTTIMFILEMNNDANKIQGVGIIKNNIVIGKSFRIYEERNYNRYTYKSDYRIDRSILNKNENDVFSVLDILLFRGSRHMKRGQGITSLPLWIAKNKHIDFIKFFRELFVKYFKLRIIHYREMETKPEMNGIINETLCIKKKAKKILIHEEDTPIVEKEMKTQKVLTEDLGKIFEMAICLLYEIEYDGKYKYSLEEATTIKDKLHKLKVEFPFKIKHIAKNGSRYDFVSIDDDKIHLSAKTTKKDAKVCPQVIGQPTKKKFCDILGIDLHYNIEQIKNYIETNVKSLLEKYALNTFDCPIVYYNKHKNMILFIKLKKNINWTDYNISFSHIIKNKKWNESSCIIINGITIGEFQIHNHRDCIKFRWSFEKLLNLFNDNFEIVYLSL